MKKIILFLVLSTAFSGCVHYLAATLPDVYEMRKFHYYGVNMSPNGLYAVVWRSNSTEYTLYDLENKKIIAHRKLGERNAFAPDNKTYYTYSRNAVRRKDIYTGGIVYNQKLNNPYLYIKLFPDNKRVIAAGRSSIPWDFTLPEERDHYLAYYDENGKMHKLRDYFPSSKILDIERIPRKGYSKLVDNSKRFSIIDIEITKDGKYFYTIDTVCTRDEELKKYGVKEFNKYGLVKWRTSDLKPVKTFRSLLAGDQMYIDLSYDESKILITGAYSYSALLDAETFDIIFQNVDEDDFRLWKKYKNHPKSEPFPDLDVIDNKYTKMYGGFLSKGKYFFTIGHDKAYCDGGIGGTTVIRDGKHVLPSDFKYDNYLYVFTADKEMKLMTKMPFDVFDLCTDVSPFLTPYTAVNQISNKICLPLRSGKLLVLEYDEKENKLKKYWKTSLPKMPPSHMRYTKRKYM